MTRQHRGFGRTEDGGIEPDEAQAIRDAAAAIVAGATTVLKTAQSWNEAGRTTVRGNPWSYTSLRRVLLSPHLIADPPILTAVQQLELAAAMDTTGSRRGRPSGGSYALLGAQQLVCGRCGAFMTTGRNRGHLEYHCPAGIPLPDGGGISCGSNRIRRHLADGQVRDETVAVIAVNGFTLQGDQKALAGAAARLLTAQQARQAYEALREAGAYDDSLAARRVLDRVRRGVAAAQLEVDALLSGPVRIAPGDGAADAFDALPMPLRQQVLAALWEPIQVSPKQWVNRLLLRRR